MLAVIAAAGCDRRINPEWCAQPGHSDPLCAGLVDSDMPKCTKDEECTGGLVCDTAVTGGACVQCTETKLAACSPPICAMDRCVACESSGDCNSEVCLPAGACADSASVLYVSTTGSGTTCTHTAKCALGTALGLATAGRNTIALDPGTYSAGMTLDRSARLVGRGAILDANGPGPVIAVNNNAAIELDYLTLRNASAASGATCSSGSLTMHAVTISANQLGITSACALDLDRSIVTHNLDGAIHVTSGSIDARNNFFVNNGNINLMGTQNVVIAAGVTGAFVFNTVAYNVSKSNGRPGIQCDAVAINAEGNLVTDNHRNGVFNVAPQVAGMCDFSKSYTAPGSGNNDLAWVDVMSDFHLTAMSTPVIDVGLASCAGLTDFDGDARPMGGGCDLGADELRP